MTALTADRNTQERNREVYEFPIRAGVTIFRGALVGIDGAGAAAPAGNGAVTQIVGVAQTGSADFLTSGASAGGQFPIGGVVITQPTPFVRVRRGKQFVFANSTGGDLIAATDFGAPAYAVDDQTVAKLNTGGRLAVGTIRGVDALGVWVEI